VLRGDTATSAFQGYWPSPSPAPARTRVRGFDEPQEATSGAPAASSSRTPSGSSCSYGELASGRQKVTNLRLPGQYDERLLGSIGLQGPYYNWNRWYLPGAGRYLELDPLRLQSVGGHILSTENEWYSYAQGNPLRFTDFMGLCASGHCPDCPGGSWIASLSMMADAEGFGIAGGLYFASVYSCTTRPVTVHVKSWCAFAGAPGSAQPIHLGLGGSAILGGCKDSPCIEDLAGESQGYWGTIGFGVSVTYFDEGHCKGYLAGAGAGVYAGVIKCKSWVTYSSQ
jgi:RHS repeat-associated protein